MSTTKALEGQNCLVSQREFIKELTTSNGDCYETLSKRSPLPNLAPQNFHPRKLLIVTKAFSATLETVPVLPQVLPNGLDQVSSVTSPALSFEAADFTTMASTLDSTSVDQKNLDLLMRDQFECHKVLLKHFLLETIANEKFNLSRFNFLPLVCQKLILAFLKTHFGFDLSAELALTSHKKYLYCLKGKQYSAAGGSNVSLSFVMDCYLYGLRKQLQSGGRNVDQSKAIQALHQTLFPSTDAGHLATFQQTIEQLLRYESGAMENSAAAVLSLPLLMKMSQISEKTLRKFYSVKLHKCLSSLIDDSKTLADLKKNISCKTTTIDILSAYIGVESGLPRQYRISVLHINNHSSI